MSVNDFYNSSPVSEIVGREPRWLIRSGIGVVFSFVCLLLLLSYFIKYPDTIAGEVIIEIDSPSIKHFATTSGKINNLLIEEAQFVTRNTALAVIDSSIDHRLVLKTETLLNETFNIEEPRDMFNRLRHIALNGELGQLQVQVNALLTSLNEYILAQELQELQFNRKKSDLLIANYRQLITKLREKLEPLEEKISLAKKDLDNALSLAQKKLQSENGVNLVKQRMLDAVTKRSDALIEIELYELNISELENEYEEFLIEFRRKNSERLITIQDQRSLLLSQIKIWKSKHLMVAKSSGTVSFNKKNLADIQVSTTDNLFSIIPLKQSFNAWINVSGERLADVSIGQVVQIDLDKYPASKHGLFKAEISHINPLPSNEGYLLSLKLPELLISKRGSVVENQFYLKGSGEIITRPNRLITKLMDKIFWYGNSTVQ